MYKCTINFIPLSQPSLNFKLTTSPDKSEYFFDGLNDGGASKEKRTNRQVMIYKTLHRMSNSNPRN
jgi:hypothetical protein